ncbi:A24 family peptidase [Saccharopolyspora cebuensis]|uniref:Prepilin peptidase n=1 Tax=Saccharopolyspora cebuensis TaxID=418759 RepID=A0ABV4CKR7_9PSEU
MSILTGLLLGAAAGAAGARLLRALGRGVRPPPLCCASAVAVLWAVVAARLAGGAFGWWWAPVPLLLGWVGVLLAVCDLRAARLPDALTLPAHPVAACLVGLAAAHRPAALPGVLVGALLGAALFGGGYLVVRLLAPAALGPGDVKLAAPLGAVVGAVSVPAVLAVMGVAAVLTALWSARRGGAGVPHGPAMLLPAWCATVFPPWWWT